MSKKMKKWIFIPAILILAVTATVVTAVTIMGGSSKGAELNTSIIVNSTTENGLRLVGDFSDIDVADRDGVTFGMVIGWGAISDTDTDYSQDKLTKGSATFGSGTTYYEGELEDGDYLYVSIYGIPEDNYSSGISFRTYTIDNGEMVYGAAKTVYPAEIAMLQYYGAKDFVTDTVNGELNEDFMTSILKKCDDEAVVVHTDKSVDFLDNVGFYSNGSISYAGSTEAYVLEETDTVYISPYFNISLSAITNPAECLTVAEYRAVGALYRDELKSYKTANPDVTTIKANYYTMAGNDVTGLISAYIPSFESKYMTAFEIQGNELVYVGADSQVQEELNSIGIGFSSEPISNLARTVSDVVDADAYEAVLNMAYEYYYQGNQIQYDQSNARRNLNAIPNASSSDKDIYLDCSSFVNAVYYNSFSTNIDDTVKTSSYMAAIGSNYKEDDAQYVSYYQRSSSDESTWYGGIGEKNTLTAEDVLKQLQETLQPGDLLVYQHDETLGKYYSDMSGHVYIYLGNGEFMHCTGYSGKTSSQTAGDVENFTTVNHDNSNSNADAQLNETECGAINILEAKYLFDESTNLYNAKDMNHHKRFLLYNGGSITKEDGTTRNSDDDKGDKVWTIGVMRPLANMTDYSTLTEAAQSVLAYPGLTIEKTISNTSGNAYYKTVSADSKLTVTISLLNSGKHVLTNVVIKDAECTNTDNVVATVTRLDYTESDDSKKYTYTLTVSGAKGDFVTTTNAFVNDIKSNTVCYVVGERAADFVSNLQTSIDKAIESGTAATALGAAMSIYKSAGVSFLTELSDTSTPAKQTKSNEDFEYYTWSDKWSVLGTLYGGTDLNPGSDFYGYGTDYIRRVRSSYLEAGDVIITTSTSGSSRVIESVYIYMGADAVYKMEPYEDAENTYYRPALYKTATDDTIGLLTSLYYYSGYMIIRPGLTD